MALSFAEENYDDCAEGIKSLVQSAWEQNHHGALTNAPPEPNYEAYKNLNDAGMLGCVVVRDNKEIVGYATYYLTTLMHHQFSKCAVSDSVFVKPERNSVLVMRELVRRVEEAAEKRKAVKMNWMCLVTNAFGDLLRHMTYEREIIIYGKHLNV